MQKCIIVFFSFIQIIYASTNIMRMKNGGNEFVSIFDDPNFGRLRNRSLKESLDLENHNFNGKPIRLLFHEDPGMIVSNDKNKGVTGFFGEIWTFLSEYANFTLILQKAHEKRIGLRPTVNSSYTGLLRYIEFGQVDAIAKIEIFNTWSDVVDFFLPLWNDRARLFVPMSYQENIHWIAHLFKHDVWCTIAIFYILFVLASVTVNTNRIKNESAKNNLVFDYKDYLLYYYGIFCQRSYHLIEYQKSCKILNTCACLYSVLILNFYSLKILDVLLNKTEIKPFNSLESLYRKTDFLLISLKDSVVHLKYEFLKVYENEEPGNELRYLIKSKRITFHPTRKHMYHLACTSTKNYALFESEYLKSNVAKYGCTFRPLGKGYYHTWIASGVRKNFKYKKTIDMGILKLLESGILDALKKRLIGLKITHNFHAYEPINFEKVYMVNAIFITGVLLSILILFIECLSDYLHAKRNRMKQINRVTF